MNIFQCRTDINGKWFVLQNVVIYQIFFKINFTLLNTLILYLAFQPFSAHISRSVARPTVVNFHINFRFLSRILTKLKRKHRPLQSLCFWADLFTKMATLASDWQRHFKFHWSPYAACEAQVRHTLQPLCDLSATDNFHQSQRSQQGPRSVPARLQRSRRLIGDLVATKSVAARFLCKLIWSQTGPGKVADQSPISRRLVADRSPTNFVRIGAWLSLKLVGDWSAIGRRLIGDLSATSLQLVGDLSATCSKIYSIS